MKWRNHRLTTGVIAFACTGHLLPVIFASLGSIFPDAIEGHDYTSDHWILSAALCEAQIYRALELDGLSDGALKSHKMVFRTVMRLAVSLGIATQEDSERIWEKGRAAAEDLAAWKAEEHQRKAAEVRREKRKAARGGGEVR